MIPGAPRAVPRSFASMTVVMNSSSSLVISQPYVAVNGHLGLTLKELLLVSFIGLISAIAADAIVIVVTWVRTHGEVRELYKLGLPVTTSTIMLRDGT